MNAKKVRIFKSAEKARCYLFQLVMNDGGLGADKIPVVEEEQIAERVSGMDIIFQISYNPKWVQEQDQSIQLLKENNITESVKLGDIKNTE